MRIAQVSPLYESVPPKFYGGTERMVSYLTEELVAQGHDVTLFASGDSETTADLVSASTAGLRLDPTITDPLAYHYIMLEMVARNRNDFDVIHFHTDYFHFTWSQRTRHPHVTTLHGRLDIPEVIKLHQMYLGMPLVSISNSQREPIRECNWVSTIYHGIPSNLYRLNRKPQRYLAFLGRISTEKRLDRAIEIAERCSMPLKVAAKVDPSDKEYFRTEIEPKIKNSPHVEYIGEISDVEKQEFLGNACGLIFPIDWPEPFGLVMIEAMACGTPVIAFRNGSTPEVVTQSITGFIVDSVDEAVNAVSCLPTLDRDRCRLEFEHRFSARRMAHEYVEAYRKQLRFRRLTPDRNTAVGAL